MIRAHTFAFTFGALLTASSLTASAQPYQAPPPPPAPPAPAAPAAPAAPQAPQAPQTPQTPQAPLPATAAPTQPVVVVAPNGNAQVPAPSQITVEPGERRDEYRTDYWGAPVFTSGVLVFGASYGAAVITAASSDHKGDNRLYVPLLGPWLDLGTRGSCPVSSSSCDHETTDKVLVVVDGIFQAAGFISVIDGIFDPRRHGGTIDRTAERGVHVHPTAMATSHGEPAPGLALSSAF